MRVTLLPYVFAGAFGVCTGFPGVAAADESGRDIAANCATCHHGDSRAGAPVPSLAGMDKAALVRRVREFRDGVRPSTIMKELAKGYTDAQIEAAAAYLATQKP
ncbi:MAG TPA: c-type cytochrome [Casimicrobiaceae bacterium]|jgi:cytochrome c553